MAGGDDPKEFPDVSQKLAAPKKLSAFEKERQAAEEKKRRAEAENAAALREFEDSFGGDNDNDDGDDRYDGFPRINAPHGPRGGGLGFGGGGRLGGPPSGPRGGPGSLGPVPGPPPPSMKRKRALDEMREAQAAKRGADALVDEHMGRRSDRGQLFPEAHEDENEDDPEDIAPRPTVQLTNLPPTMGTEDIKLLLRDHLFVHSVRVQPGQTTGIKRSMTAIATLSAETSTAQIDSTVSTLKDKYLGYGFSLSISRHLSSTSLLPAISTAPVAASTEPFGAQKPQRDQPPRFGHRNAPPPSEFAPPDSYDAHARQPAQKNATISVQPPLDIHTIRAVHTIADRLLSEPNPERALEIEAMLMALPEVANDERFSFLYDSRSPAGVYYRFLLWNDDYSYDSIQELKRTARGPERILDDVIIDWLPPHEEVPFADLTKLGEVIDHMNYESSEEESDSGEEERKFNTGRKEGEGPAQLTDRKHLTPLQVAKFAWMLSRMPSTHSQLRKGDVAPITSFAINHAGAGAEEIVDMLVLNVEKPYTVTQCARFDTEDVSQDEDDDYEPGEELPTLQAASDGDAQGNEPKENEDPSASKLVALYLINDILHNSSTAGVRNAWKYRQLFENAFKRQKIFEHLGRLDKELGWGRMRTDKWRRQIAVLFEIWESGSVFASDVFEALKKNFYDEPVEPGQDVEESNKPEEKWMGRFKRVEGTGSPAASASPATGPIVLPPQPAANTDVGLDGNPMDDLDGTPMDDDADGTPMDDDLDGEPMDDVDGTPMDEDEAMEHAPAAVQQPPEEPAAGMEAKTGFSIKGASTNNPQSSPATATPAPPRRRKLAEDMFADSDED